MDLIGNRPGHQQQQQKEELPIATFLRRHDRRGRCRLFGFCLRARSSSPLSPFFNAEKKKREMKGFGSDKRMPDPKWVIRISDQKDGNAEPESEINK